MIKYPRVAQREGQVTEMASIAHLFVPPGADEESAIPLTCQKGGSVKDALKPLLLGSASRCATRGNRELSASGVVSGFAPAAARAFKFRDASLSLRDAPLLHKKDLALQIGEARSLGEVSTETRIVFFSSMGYAIQ